MKQCKLRHKPISLVGLLSHHLVFCFLILDHIDKVFKHSHCNCSGKSSLKFLIELKGHHLAVALNHNHTGVSIHTLTKLTSKNLSQTESIIAMNWMSTYIILGVLGIF